MKMNRRKALIGIGSLAVGSGAALGSGAFTSVEANREVSVQTAGDSSGYLQLEGDDEYVTDDSGSGPLTIDLGGDSTPAFNEEATTIVQGVFTVANNAADNENIDVGFGSSGSLEATTTVDLADGQVQFEINGGNVPTITPSDSPVPVKATIDTTVSPSSTDTADLTIYANDTDGQ